MENYGHLIRIWYLEETGWMLDISWFRTFSVKAKNKPTFLRSHFVGQDNVECFKNMEWMNFKIVKLIGKGIDYTRSHFEGMEVVKMEIGDYQENFWQSVTEWKK